MLAVKFTRATVEEAAADPDPLTLMSLRTHMNCPTPYSHREGLQYPLRIVVEKVET
jgi:hypothetical protein